MTDGKRWADDDAFAAALAEAREGSERGFSAVFTAFQPRLIRYLRAREPARADDLAGETWLAVAAQIRRFEGTPSAFAAWVFTIAHHRLADHRRTGARRRTQPVADVPEQRNGPSSEDVGLDKLSAQRAADLIARTLPHDQSEVVLLRTLGDLSVAEVATVMGRSEGWVRVTHHRALERLRQVVVEEHL